MQRRINAADDAAYDTNAAKVPRNRRAASTLSSVRRLLRHLSEPHELATNALTAHFFRDQQRRGATAREGVAATRDAIAAALERIRSMHGDAVARERNRRAAALVSRCDLEGAEHDDVARELGVSRRQFYRDRRIALELLGAELENGLRMRPLAVSAAADGATLAFESAEALVAVGKFTDAKRTLERIAESGAAPDDRARALCDAAEIACEELDDRAAARFITDAQSLWSQTKTPSAPASARLSLARAARATLAGKLDEAAALREDAVTSLRRAPHSEQRSNVLTRALLAEAAAVREAGEITRAIALVDEAEAHLRSARNVDAWLEALLLNEKGASLMLLPGRLDAASESHRRASQLSRERRFMRIAFASILNDCAIDYWQGKTKAAYATAIEVFEAARDIVSPNEFSRMALLVATFAVAANDAPTALRLVTEAKPHSSKVESIASRALLAEAHIHLRNGGHERAATLAREASEVLDDAGASTLTGTALLYTAQALAELGEHGRARETIHDAIERLERSGSPFALAKAYRLAAKLTGEKALVKRAREVTESLANARP